MPQTINFEKTKERIQAYFDNTLARKFSTKFELDREVVDVLALISILGGEQVTWLNGEKVALKDIQIHLELSYPEQR